MPSGEEKGICAQRTDYGMIRMGLYLFPIYDLQSPSRKPLSYITCMEPSAPKGIVFDFEVPHKSVNELSDMLTKHLLCKTCLLEKKHYPS